MSCALLELHEVEKSFFGVSVLKGVSFAVPPGGAVGLVGENGAGKSTLMNILGGNLQAEGGRIYYNGAEFSPPSPADATRAGIAFIHQELNLFPNLSIAENFFLTSFPRTGPLIDRGAIHERSRVWLEAVGLAADPGQVVESLSPGERQLVEIAKALSIDAKLIIFDEPTTSLSAREIEELFNLIKELRSRGIALIYISHTLEEVFQLCDEIVVLRDGAVAGAGPTPSFTREKLISLMIGRPVSHLFPQRMGSPSDKPLLEVRNLRQKGCRTGISFTLHRGEILGLAGLMGAGRTELARTLFGLDPHESGTIELEGRQLDQWSSRQLIELGLAFLTENRQLEGLCLDGTVAENSALASLREHSRTIFRWISRESLDASVARICRAVGLDPKVRLSQGVRTLSGGNQQKIVLGKWLLRAPRVLILDEPTRGIDVGAKFEVYRLIQELADNGAGVLLISSELEELIGLCDRLFIMRGGTFVEEITREKFDRSRILEAALGNKVEAA